MPQEKAPRSFRFVVIQLVALTIAAATIGLTPALLHAQTAGEGTIAGTVRDSSGAVIPDATVSATNAATNISTTRTTSDAGIYVIAPLPPGIYSVTVTAKGFRTLKQSNLDVVGLGQLGFDPVLSIGTATETVEVTAAPPCWTPKAQFWAR